jgi:hypothetical protein
MPGKVETKLVIDTSKGH